MGFKLAEGKGPGQNHRDAKAADSKELWKNVDKDKSPPCKSGIGGTCTRALCLQHVDMLTANLDIAFVLASSSEVIGQLHSQPRFRGAAESL